MEVLLGLFDSRVMSLAHATALYFDGRAESAKKRVQRLKAAGLMRERPRQSYEPSVLYLTFKGFQVLSEQGRLTTYPRIARAEMENRARVSSLTLRHELAVMDVKAALCPAVSKTDGTNIAEFSTWPLLFQFEACATPDGSPVLVKPDGFIRIHETEASGDAFEHTFFLEVDRSTETQETLVSRSACYVDYYRRGGLAVKSGRSPSDYRDFPFRTLVVLQNSERRNNTAERLLMHSPPILSQVWLTTMKEILSDPLGAIWIRPMDYRNATAGSPFEPTHMPAGRTYRRQTEREAFVESRVGKQKLLEPDGN